MIDPEILDAIPEDITRLYHEFVNWTYADIARRLKKAGGWTPTSIYQLQTLQQSNIMESQDFEADYKKRLQELLRKSNAEIDALFAQAADEAYGYDKDLFTATGKPFLPLSQNPRLQQIVHAAVQQTKLEIGTLTNSRALKVMTSYGKYQPLPKFFSQTLDNVTYQVASGVTSYNEAIKRAVDEMIQGRLVNGVREGGGIRVVRYESPGKRPVNRRIEGVVRANVLTAVAQMAGQISASNIVELDARHAWVSAHTGARIGKGGGFGDITNHLEWQGRIYSISPKFFAEFANTIIDFIPDPNYPDLITYTGLGDVAGLLGTFCRHQLGAIFPQFQSPPLSKEQLQQLREEAEKTTHYKWTDTRGVEHERDFTLRDALDRQRELERAMRLTRSRANAMKHAGQDDEYTTLKGHYRRQRAEYRRFSRAMGITEQWERVYMDGLGRI